MKHLTLAAVAAATVFAIAPVQAKEHTVAVCSVTDLLPQASACSGFYSGNLLNNEAGNVLAQKAALSSLGFNWAGDFNAVEKIEFSGMSVDFDSLLNGTTFVALHFGNGQGGPGNGTAFYRFDAGTNLDTFSLSYSAVSNAVLYSTALPPVPEPETYALMLVGLAAVGWAARRRAR